MPPAPVGQPPPAPFSAGVVVPQAARRPEMLESETAAPPDRRRKSRRVVARRRSFGCIKHSLLNRLAGLRSTLAWATICGLRMIDLGSRTHRLDYSYTDPAFKKLLAA